ncbi:MAG: type II toxin-antitoxin system RelE/ParE family toxin [Gammaproteobacteria bacterium]|nr:type II toxin-antitoxin system RelE/ParE family toxin [Gammaproteobacteria bacterium]
MRPIIIHPDAISDIQAIQNAMLKASGNRRRKLKIFLARVLAVIEQVKADPELQDKLLDHGWIGNGISISKWLHQYGKPYFRDLWRIKMWDKRGTLIPYRIIYAFQPISRSNSTQTFHVLALIHRKDIDYDNEKYSARVDRIFRDYDSII